MISVNAQTFCLLVRQNLLESQIQRINDDTSLYEKQLLKVDVDKDITVELQVKIICSHS